MFQTEDGREILPEQLIFPLVSFDIHERAWRCVGTGFFIQKNGGFVTAKHVFVDFQGNALDTLYGVHTTSSNERHLRPVIMLSAHNEADICVGMLGQRRMDDGTNGIPEVAYYLMLDFKLLENEERVSTFAFPMTRTQKLENNQVEFTFKGEWAAGEVVAFHEEGSPMVRNKCYQTSMHINHGASGGPVLKNNLVVGLNSSGMDVLDGEPPISFITPIDLILDLYVSDGLRSMTIRELIHQGTIEVKKYPDTAV